MLVAPSNVLALSIPLFGLVNPEAGLSQRLIVERGYWEAMNWLEDNGKPDDVVLASPNVSLWIPAWSSKRVVYGHPWETLNAEIKLAQVRAWYAGEGCDDLLAQYHVRFVVLGPQERALGVEIPDSDRCYADLAANSSRVLDFRDVSLFELVN